MCALRSMLFAREKERKWQFYTAEMLHYAARANYKQFPFPTYTEYAQKPKKQDTRTADQIRRTMIADLRGGTT